MTTEIPNITEQTIAIAEPVGKSKTNEIKMPKRHESTPTIGEKIMIFFISYENW